MLYSRTSSKNTSHKMNAGTEVFETHDQKVSPSACSSNSKVLFGWGFGLKKCRANYLKQKITNRSKNGKVPFLCHVATELDKR